MKKFYICVFAILSGFSASAATIVANSIVRATDVAQTNGAADAASLQNNVAAQSTADQAVVDEIKARYNASYDKAKNYCPVISEKIDALKVMTGISTAASGVGTLAGGTAAVTGFMKLKTDKEIAEISASIEKLKKIAESDDVGLEAAIKSGAATDRLEKLDPKAENPTDLSVKEQELNTAQTKSQTLGTIRTVGNFAAGGTAAVGSVTSFIGLAQFDELTKDMEQCNAAVSEIDRQKTELSFAAPDDPALAQMNAILSDCSGMNPNNIKNIKGQLTASGAIVAVAAATGIAGGVTSMIAGNKEKGGASATTAGKAGGTKELNMASNVLAVATTATNLIGTIISGVTLADLTKNGDIAAKCKDAF